MGKNAFDRRFFLKSCVAGAAAAAGLTACAKTPGNASEEAASVFEYDAKGLPTRVLGRTGVSVPAIGIGCGSRYCAVEDRVEGEIILRTAATSPVSYSSVTRPAPTVLNPSGST